MKKFIGALIAIVLIVSVASCSSQGAKVEKTGNVAETSADKQKEQQEEKKVPTYKLGDIVKVNDKYEFALTKAFLTSDRNQFAEQKFNKVAILEYTYKNISNPEDLYISEANFKVYDEEGNALATYPADISKYSQAISQGKKCTGQSAFGFNNGTKLTVEFYDNMFSGKADAVFQIEVK